MPSGLGPGDDELLVYLLEGTPAVVGPEFFAALVKHLCSALDVAGAWVTELSADRSRLSAFAFWFQDHYIRDYKYAVEGTPCTAPDFLDSFLNYRHAAGSKASRASWACRGDWKWSRSTSHCSL